ncbi:hypothetical protein FRC17_001127 [Serendipita sp. 399]|nr:hypothetical protein FRC17_001127 [Serendipita sp. 399]
MSDVGGTVLLISKAKVNTSHFNTRHCSTFIDDYRLKKQLYSCAGKQVCLPLLLFFQGIRWTICSSRWWSKSRGASKSTHISCKRGRKRGYEKIVALGQRRPKEANTKVPREEGFIALADYTHNPGLQEPGASSWWYPEGNRTLKLKLFDSLGEDARALRIGSVCRVKYIRVKSENGSLVGYCGAPSGVILRVHEGDVYYQNLKARKRGLKIEDREILSNDDDNYNMTLTQNRNSTPPRHSSIPARNNMKSSPDPETSEASDVAPLPMTAGSSSGSVTAHSGTFEHPAPVPKAYPPFPSFAGEIEHSDLIESVASLIVPPSSGFERGSSTSTHAISTRQSLLIAKYAKLLVMISLMANAEPAIHPLG